MASATFDNATVTQLMSAYSYGNGKSQKGVEVDNAPWPSNMLHIKGRPLRNEQAEKKQLAVAYKAANSLLTEVMSRGHNIWGDNIDESPYRIVCSVWHLLREIPTLSTAIRHDSTDMLFRAALSAYLSLTGQREGKSQIVSANNARKWRLSHEGQP